MKPVAYIGALGLWIVAAGLPGLAPVARWAGMLVFQLSAALLIWWIWTRRETPRPGLLSPWVFVIAAGVALLGRFGAAA